MYAPIGSISTGTLRTKDLLQAFADALEQYESPLSIDSMKAIEEARTVDPDSEDASWLVNEALPNALQNTCTAPYCYFGTLEGDGADFGFWPSIDSLEEECSDDAAVLKVSDTSHVPDYVMHVNDHGNVTLYSVELKEVWSCV